MLAPAEHGGPRRGLAAVDVLRGEATQAPLVFLLVTAVLAVSTVTVELSNGFQDVFHIGDHHRVFPQPLTLKHTGASQVQVQLQLFAINTSLVVDDNYRGRLTTTMLAG